VGVLLSLGLSAWFLKSVEWSELGGALADVKLWAVALASCLVLLEFVFRALRWKVVLRPVAPEVRILDLWTATVIGAATNSLLPARAGEVAKPLVATRKTGIPLSSLVATIVMERVYDIFGLVCVLLAMVAFLPADVGAGDPYQAELVSNLKLYGGIAGVGALGAMAVFFALASRGEQAKRVFSKITSLAPAPVAKPFDTLFAGFVAGLDSARSFSSFLKAWGCSLGIWFNGAAAIYVLFLAFSLDLPFGAACFTTVAIALAIALPQAPAGLGVFHVVIEETLKLWGTSIADAQAFALVFWAVSFLPVTVIGLLALWREGLSLRGIWSKGGESGPPPAPPVAQSAPGEDP
jgi:uncharacterized protein (TIRG00374 family)